LIYFGNVAFDRFKYIAFDITFDIGVIILHHSKHSKKRDHDFITHYMHKPHFVPRGILYFLIGKLLEKNAMTGSEIMMALEEATSGVWRPSPGSIYPALAELERKGFIEATDADGRRKKYHLTDYGKETLEELKKNPKWLFKFRKTSRLWHVLFEPKDQILLFSEHIKEILDELLESLGKLDEESKLEERDKVVNVLQDYIAKFNAL